MATVKKYGIDISYYQGAPNWAAVKAAGVEFVILRGGYGVSNVDTQFINNIEGAIAAGFTQIGVYWFSYAHDVDSAATEVTKCLDTIAPYRASITLPVWFDWEEASYSYVERVRGISLTGAQIREIATAWCNGIVAAGYSTGIYSNKSNASGWFKLANGQYLWEQLGVEFWYARYGANDETQLFITPAFEATALSEHPETNIFQYSDVGVVSGISSQRVDLNIRYEDTPDPPTPPEPPTPVEPTERLPADNIEYVEIRNADAELIGIIDTAKSVIWHAVYYGVGDFEVYTPATESALSLLQVGNLVIRSNDIEVGVIESINIADNVQDGKMITAAGRFAKSVLDRRHIYKLSGASNTATILLGNVETAVRQVVSDNAIACGFDSSRNISLLELGALSGIGATIVDENGNAAQKQVSFQNLLEYTDEVLAEYKLGSLCVLDADEGKLQYVVYAGADRSADNTAGNAPVIFSREYDNLTDSEYTHDESNAKNAALIGGAGEGIERFYALLVGSDTGLDRRETWVDAGSINKTYKDAGSIEHTYTDAEYTALLKQQGRQALRDLTVVDDFSGTLDVTNGSYVYNRDFSLGDLVTVQDNDINKFANVRISEVTEVQDENGYHIDAKYITD